MNSRCAVVIGATGLIGSFLLKKLVQNTYFDQIIVIARKKSAPGNASLSSPKVRFLHFDFTNWSELELQISSFAGPTRLSFFCCLGTTMKTAGSKEAFKKVDFDYVVSFAKLAKNCKAEQLLIVSALGAASGSKNFYNHTKGEMEAAVQNEFSGELHFMRPSLLLGDRKEFRLMERVAILLAPIYSALLFGPLKKFRPVPAEKVARTMMLIATKKISAELFVENQKLLKN